MWIEQQIIACMNYRLWKESLKDSHFKEQAGGIGLVL